MFLPNCATSVNRPRAEGTRAHRSGDPRSSKAPTPSGKRPFSVDRKLPTPPTARSAASGRLRTKDWNPDSFQSLFDQLSPKGHEYDGDYSENGYSTVLPVGQTCPRGSGGRYFQERSSKERPITERAAQRKQVPVRPAANEDHEEFWVELSPPKKPARKRSLSNSSSTNASLLQEQRQLERELEELERDRAERVPPLDLRSLSDFGNSTNHHRQLSASDRQPSVSDWYPSASRRQFSASVEQLSVSDLQSPASNRDQFSVSNRQPSVSDLQRSVADRKFSASDRSVGSDSRAGLSSKADSIDREVENLLQELEAFRFSPPGFSSTARDTARNPRCQWQRSPNSAAFNGVSSPSFVDGPVIRSPSGLKAPANPAADRLRQFCLLKKQELYWQNEITKSRQLLERSLERVIRQDIEEQYFYAQEQLCRLEKAITVASHRLTPADTKWLLHHGLISTVTSDSSNLSLRSAVTDQRNGFTRIDLDDFPLSGSTLGMYFGGSDFQRPQHSQANVLFGNQAHFDKGTQTPDDSVSAPAAVYERGTETGLRRNDQREKRDYREIGNQTREPPEQLQRQEGRERGGRGDLGRESPWQQEQQQQQQLQRQLQEFQQLRQQQHEGKQQQRQQREEQERRRLLLEQQQAREKQLPLHQETERGRPTAPTTGGKPEAEQRKPEAEQRKPEAEQASDDGSGRKAVAKNFSDDDTRDSAVAKQLSGDDTGKKVVAKQPSYDDTEVRRLKEEVEREQRQLEATLEEERRQYRDQQRRLRDEEQRQRDWLQRQTQASGPDQQGQAQASGPDQQDQAQVSVPFRNLGHVPFRNLGHVPLRNFGHVPFRNVGHVPLRNLGQCSFS